MPLIAKKIKDVPAVSDKSKKKTDENKIKTKPQFIAVGDFDGMQERVENESTQSLQKYEEYIIKDGINLGVILPGMTSTDGHPIVTKTTHGFMNSGCCRSTKSDRFETCPKCDYWFKNRSSKEEKDRGVKRHADDISPSTKSLLQYVDFTWAVEHERVKDGDKIVEKPITTEIDPERIKERPCFLDETALDSTSEKCKNCPALRSCFQGPQYLLLSGERTKEVMIELGRIAAKKKIKINGKEVSLKGNISLAWWLLNPIAAKGDEESLKKAKEIARMVSYPFIVTKTVDPKLDKMKGTRYKVSFAREPFIIPAKFQKRALDRARDMGEYRKPISREQAAKELKAWLEQSVTKPACFDNSDIKDSDECMGKDGCAAYRDCCVKNTNKSNEKKDDKKGSGSESKQKRSTAMIMEEDDDEVSDLMKHLGNK
jgi:hypothetical protein